MQLVTMICAAALLSSKVFAHPQNLEKKGFQVGDDFDSSYLILIRNRVTTRDGNSIMEDTKSKDNMATTTIIMNLQLCRRTENLQTPPHKPQHPRSLQQHLWELPLLLQSTEVLPRHPQQYIITITIIIPQLLILGFQILLLRQQVSQAHLVHGLTTRRPPVLSISPVSLLLQQLLQRILPVLPT